MTGAPENAGEDPRWAAFNQSGFACSCGERHVGLFPINMLQPIGWDGRQDYEPDENLSLDRSFISSNYCVWEGQSFAMRMRFPIQISGASPAAFMYTVWAAVERKHLEAYVRAKATGSMNTSHKFGARLINRIAGYHDTANLVGLAYQQDDGWPPMLVLQGPQPYTNRPDHPLLAEQRFGIGVDRMLDLFAQYGHDMRASATANIS